MSLLAQAEGAALGKLYLKTSFSGHHTVYLELKDEAATFDREHRTTSLRMNGMAGNNLKTPAGHLC